MWKEEIRVTRFPYEINSEIEAKTILFKNCPERLVLLKWIYTLISGLSNDPSKEDLADYFHNLGIVDGESFKFVEGNSSVKHQEKVWNNLFRAAKMMKYSTEISQNFAEKYCSEMPVSLRQSISKTAFNPISLESSIPNLDNIISTLEEEVTKPHAVSSGDNNITLCKLKEFLNKLSLITSEIKLPESDEVKDTNEYDHHYIAHFCKNIQTLETVLTSSSNTISSVMQLEKNLDDHLLKSEDTLELVCKLKRLSGTF